MIYSRYSSHKITKLEVNNKRKFWTGTTIWKLSNTFKKTHVSKKLQGKSERIMK